MQFAEDWRLKYTFPGGEPASDLGLKPPGKSAASFLSIFCGLWEESSVTKAGREQLEEDSNRSFGDSADMISWPFLYDWRT